MNRSARIALDSLRRGPLFSIEHDALDILAAELDRAHDELTVSRAATDAALEANARLARDAKRPRRPATFPTFELARDFAGVFVRGFPAWRIVPHGERWAIESYPSGPLFSIELDTL